MIASRQSWGARHDDGQGPAPMPATEVWLHHTAGRYLDADATIEQERALMREVEATGEARFGSGISYTALVFPSGRPYQGHSPGRLGTHTGGRNSVGRAICLPGDYTRVDMTPQQVRGVAHVLRHGHDLGWWRAPALRGGHRDVLPLTGQSIATACPGDRAHARIPEINAEALRSLQPPPPTTTRGPEMIVITCATPNRVGLLSGGLLIDITDDPTARSYAQSGINRGIAVEIRVGALTWERLAQPR
ncbi:MAG: peptidoglycan recognition protein family protein [Phycicoccus sp.]